MSPKKWLVLVAGFFLGFGVIGLLILDDENTGGRLPAHVGLAIGAALLVPAILIKDSKK